MYSSVLTAMGDINKSVKESMENVLNNQIISDDTAIITSTSSYFSLVSKVFKYNKMTGAVHGEVIFATTSSLGDGNTFKLCTIDGKYTPHNSVPVTIAMDLNDCIVTGRIKDNSEDTNPSSIVVRTHMSIEKNNIIRVSFDYYIEPGLVD